MVSTAILPEDQKIFSMQELKEKGFSQYKVSKLVSEGKLIKLNKSIMRMQIIVERNRTFIILKPMHRRV